MRISDLYETNLDKIQTLINKSEWRDMSIYRGTSILVNEGLDYKIIDIPRSGYRSKALHTKHEVHKLINTVSEQKLGVQVRNGLFGTMELQDAIEYGDGDYVLVVPLSSNSVYSARGINDFTTSMTYNNIYHSSKNKDKEGKEDFLQLVNDYVDLIDIRHPNDPLIGDEELMIFGKVLLIRVEDWGISNENKWFIRRRYRTSIIPREGISGSGKSTYAHKLKEQGLVDSVLEADQYFVDSKGNYNFEPSKIKQPIHIVRARLRNYYQKVGLSP